jgi:hypothetical protein
MNSKNAVLLSLVLVALLVRSTLGGAIVNINLLASPAPGFDAYKVSLIGTQGRNILGVMNLNLRGVHQIWQNAAAGPRMQSPVVGDTTGTFGNPAWTELDSHLLVNPSAGGDPVVVSPGFGLSETNDGSNPGGLSADSLAPTAPFNSFTGSAGIGNLRFSGFDPIIAWNSPMPQTVDLLYVVVPNFQTPILSMQIIDSAESIVNYGNAPPQLDDLGPLVGDIRSNGPGTPTFVEGTLPASDDRPLRTGSKITSAFRFGRMS